MREPASGRGSGLRTAAALRRTHGGSQKLGPHRMHQDSSQALRPDGAATLTWRIACLQL